MGRSRRTCNTRRGRNGKMFRYRIQPRLNEKRDFFLGRAKKVKPERRLNLSICKLLYASVTGVALVLKNLHQCVNPLVVFSFLWFSSFFINNSQQQPKRIQPTTTTQRDPNYKSTTRRFDSFHNGAYIWEDIVQRYGELKSIILAEILR